MRRNGRGYIYPDPFEEAWNEYPDRRGSNPKKGAYRKWRERVMDGVPALDLLSAVEAYARFVRSEGVEGESTVMMARTFFGPDEPWAQDWASMVEDGADWIDDL